MKLIYETKRLFLRILDGNYSEKVLDYVIRSKDFFSKFEPERDDNSDKIIGQVSFYNIVSFAFLSCHIGYKSDKDEINRGIITEAVRRGIEIMFSEYGMHRIEAHVMPNNKASIRILEKIGFINEGIAHRFLEINGVWEDHLHLALINDNI